MLGVELAVLLDDGPVVSGERAQAELPGLGGRLAGRRRLGERALDDRTAGHAAHSSRYDMHGKEKWSSSWQSPQR